MEPTQARAVLREALTILRQLAVPHWLSAGTCLGAFRDGLSDDFLRGDGDLDIDIEGPQHINVVETAFRNAGWATLKRCRRMGDWVTLYMQKAGTITDLVFYRRIGNHLVAPIAEGCFVQPVELTAKIESWLMDDGFSAPLPSPPAIYLTHRYGPGWSTPEPKGDWQKATKSFIPAGRLNRVLVPTMHVAVHFGLGDFLCSYGLVRTLASAGPVILYCPARHLPTLSEAYHGTGVRLAVRNCYEDAVTAVHHAVPDGGRPLILGWADPAFDGLRKALGAFDRVFYAQARLPFFLKTFYPLPVTEAPLPVPSGPFAFVHDDADRGYPIDVGRIPEALPIVRPQDLGRSLFEYREVLLAATEIHVIDSAFFNYVAMLIGEVPALAERVWWHRYARPNDPPDIPAGVHILE